MTAGNETARPATALTPAAARRVLLTLTWTRWLPTGLMIATLTLWQLDRGLTVAQALTAMAFGGAVTVLLELPTSAVADGTGRRRIYLLAAVANVAAGLAFLMAGSFRSFAVAGVLFGIFRALDSGPLEAWFVDTVHAHEPDADVDGPLAAQGSALGAAMAIGALCAGALVWWHPLPAGSALLLPIAVHAVLTAVHLIAALVLFREPPHSPVAADDASAQPGRRAHPVVQSAARSWRVVRISVAQLRLDRVLLALLAVEVCWSISMIVFEQFLPIRLAELFGSQQQAGIVVGPLTAAAWGAFAAGSALAGLVARRVGVAWTAILARALNGAGAVAMGLATGSTALAAAYLMTYALHGSNGPMHAVLLHRQAEAANRSTVLSLNSLVAFAAFAVAAPALGLIATEISTPVAMVIGGTVGILGAVFYLPARRAERSVAAVG